MRLIILFIFLLPISLFSNSAENISNQKPLILKIRRAHYSVKDKIDMKKEYKYQLLNLILSKTKKTDGPYRIEIVPTAGQSRLVELLNSGVYSTYITMTSKQREENLLPIRIPVYKGMFGYRIFLIRKGDQNRFNKIKTQDQLKKLWAGQGRDWPDYEILAHNNYNLVGSHSRLTLYGMLKKNRFDYFPRAIHEPWKEIDANLDKDLAVEKNFMLYYPAPGYIFVSKDNKKLAKRLEKGFKEAIKDGSFDQFFYNHPDIKNTLEKLNAKNRTIFHLENPLLPNKTPLDDKSLWLGFK